MKVDLHCHSEASWDCETPLRAFPAQLRSMGIQVQAITDHNEIWGAQKLQELVMTENKPDLPPLHIIVGEEVTTTEGEIIGLFLKEKIAPGMSPEETIDAIRDQEGVVLLPHGFDPLKRYRLQPDARARIADTIQLVEGFNARISRRRWNEAAIDWATTRQVPVTAGSDAHRLVDVGTAWVDIPSQSIDTPEKLLAALEGAVPEGTWVHPVLAYMLKQRDRLFRRIRALLGSQNARELS